VIVSKIDETLFAGNKEIRLATNEYEGSRQPEGFRYIRKFQRDPLPTTFFSSGESSLRKTVFMVYNSNTTVVEYTNTSKISYRLRLHPFYAVRDYHELLRENPQHDYYIENRNGYQAVYPWYGAQPFFFRYTGGSFVTNKLWFKNILYSIDKARGQHYKEDLYHPGYIDHLLAPGATVYLLFSLEEEMMDADPAELKQAELARLKTLVPAHIHNKFLADLLVTGDQFIVQRRSTSNYSVIAGYHWFTDWGRDSMIALRGLCIATGRQKEAASIISTFLEYLKHGIIPNRFPDSGKDEPEYHTIDATLWLFIAIYEYDLAFNDIEFLNRIFPRLTDIIAHYLRGTIHNIHATPSGLMAGGTPGLPLTWMDARIQNHVFTPRKGCPVEINALWYNALKIYEHTAGKINAEVPKQYMELTARFREEFMRSFWNRKGYLNDVVSTTYDVDDTIRPNQIYAVSLPFQLLPEEKEKLVVENVRAHLLTPYGLRTLQTAHPDFKASYQGDVWSRDSAYHQGTVWPFLAPEYYLAYLKVNDYSPEAKKQVVAELQPIKKHFYEEGCLYGISEIFDGLNPRDGKGCANQAWSVSNLILLITRAGLEV
jgi:predicted glycogen debranching enzyme